MAQERFDRAVDDVGNMVEIGHLNLNIPDQQAATNFYVTALGLTRDPYLMTGTDNMWVNIGRHQFHLPTADSPQRFNGTAGIVVPNLAAVRKRLSEAGIPFSGEDETLEVRSPWGNRLRLHAPDARYGPVTLAIAYLEFDVPSGSAAAIAAFYREIIGTPATIAGDGKSVSVAAGSQQLVFRESAEAAAYDGYHIQVYVADFSTPYRKLRERDLVTAENGPHQYRFVDIVDPASGRIALQLEHEVRSLRHPMFGRTLVNRDADNHIGRYAPGREALVWTNS